MNDNARPGIDKTELKAPCAALIVALGLSVGWLAAPPASAQSWQNGPPRSNTWARPSDRFETPAQRRAAIGSGARDYQPPAYRERDPAPPTGLSGPPPETASPAPAEAGQREIPRVSIFDRDRPMRAPRPKWYIAPEQNLPAAAE
jgi:hypothetical protein